MADRDDRDDRDRRGVVPLIMGQSGTTAATGRHRSLATLSLRGLPEGRIDGFVAAIKAQGVRATRDGNRLIVPARDRAAVQGLIDLERLAPVEAGRRFDDRWWVGLVDAAIDLADEGTDDPDVIERWFEAHATFLKRGLVHSSLRPEVHGRLLGLADAVAAHLRSGRLEHAAAAADRLAESASRLR